MKSNLIVLFVLILMLMSHVHAAPFENPETNANSDELFEGAIVFIMPSMQNMNWTLDVAISSNGMIDTVNLIIPKVKMFDEPRKISVVSDIDSAKYFISIVEPLTPEVGINNFEITVHVKESMMNFPAVTDLTIEIEPEMPSMGHGSPNNVNPIHVSNGHYVGEVNFTMTGWWKVNLTVYKDGVLVTDNAYFDITFQ